MHVSEGSKRDTTVKRKRRRASFGYDVALQAKVTEDTRDKVRRLADLLEVSDGQVVRNALDAYDLDARITRARGTANTRRQRAAKGRSVPPEVVPAEPDLLTDGLAEDEEGGV